MKYIYKINGKVWNEVSVSEYPTTEKTEKLSSSFAFNALIFAIFGIPGGIAGYFMPEAWGGLFFGGIGCALASTLDGDDAGAGLFWAIFSASAALISLVRIVASLS